MSKMSVLVKGSVIATVVALAFSSVAFAKGRLVKAAATTATSSQATSQILQSNWKDELSWLKVDTTVLGQFDRLLEGIGGRSSKDVKTARDLSGKRSDDRLGGRLAATVKDIQALLARAQSIVSTHAGFDASGAVTDQAQAAKSVEMLGSILNELRGTLIYRIEHIL